jgi:cytochrome c biogenesis protein CcmG/thiol:disulfide interchange protein DsbE
MFVCAAAIAIGALTHSWGSASQGGRSADAGLLSVTVCDDHGCNTAAWGDGDGAVSWLGYLGIAGALGAVGCCVAIGAMVLAKHTSKIPVAPMHAGMGVGAGLGLLFLIEILTRGDSMFSPGWSALFAIGGAVAAITIFQSAIVPVVKAERPATARQIDGRKIGALAVLLSIGAMVTALFLWMVPSAAAREVQAACNGMDPTWSNPAFRRLPAPAPDFQLQDIHGQPVKLSDYQGKVVLVNFWASWCDVCKSEKKSLARITRDLQGDDFQVLSVASDANPEDVDHSLRIALGPDPEHPSTREYGGAPFRIVMDPPSTHNLGDIASAWGIEKVPESFLIDRDGQIRMYLVNKREWNAGVVETCVQSLIDE